MFQTKTNIVFFNDKTLLYDDETNNNVYICL